MASLYSGNLKKDYLHYAFPCVINLIAFGIYTMVDGIFVGRFVGASALASVDLSVPFMSILYFFAIMMAVGASVLITEALGKGDHETGNIVFSQSVLWIIGAGILISVLVYTFIEPLCGILGTDDFTYANTAAYLKTLAPFFVMIILEYNLESVMKANGQPVFTMVIVILGQLTNIVLDYFFVALLGYGVAGAAAATGIAQCFIVFVLLGKIIFGKNNLFHFAAFKPDIKMMKKEIVLGFPDGMTELCAATMLWLYNQVVLKVLGHDGIVIFSVVAYLYGFVLNTLYGAGQGLEPLVSYHKGCKRKDRCDKLYGYALIFQGILALLTFAAVFVFTKPIISLFLTDISAALMEDAVSAVRLYALSFLLCGFNFVSAAYLTGLQKPKSAAAITLSRGILIHGIVLCFMAFVVGGRGIWFAASITECLTLIIGVFVIKKAGFRFQRPLFKGN